MERKSQWKLGEYENGHICTFNTSKPGNFNSLRDVNLIPMTLLP